VRAALEETGVADVEEAATGFDALRQLAAGEFQVVLLDINMPDINGLELLSYMKKSPRQQRARKILMSTRMAGGDVQRGRELGADAFLEKPFDVDELRAMMLDTPSPPASPGQGGTV
jgi:two-component system chemotaxis response regulator CheY